MSITKPYIFFGITVLLLDVFVNEYLYFTRTHSNITEETEHSDEDGDIEIQLTESDDLIDAASPGSDHETQPNTPAMSVSDTSVIAEEIPQRNKNLKRNVNKKTSTNKKDTVTDILKDYIQDKKQRRSEKSQCVGEKPTGDCVEDFFLNMGRTVKTFPPYWQAVVKNKVFQIVNSTELQLLSEDSASTSSQVPPPSNILHHHVQTNPAYSTVIRPSSSAYQPCTYFQSSSIQPVQPYEAEQTTLQYFQPTSPQETNHP